MDLKGPAEAGQPSGAGSGGARGPGTVPAPWPGFSIARLPRILFGGGTSGQLGSVVREFGRSALVVVRGPGFTESPDWARLLAALQTAGVEVSLETVSGEPSPALVDEIVARHRGNGAGSGPGRPAPIEVVVGIGGGSVMDTAKAVAGLLIPGNSVMDHLEGIGPELPYRGPSVPFVAVPTTAGTGSEATKNAVISCDDPPCKKSLRSDLMMPRAVVIDPQLSVSVPPAITAQTGMDAITQLIESYISRKARPIPQALAVQGLRLALGAIEEAVENGASQGAREAMAQAALLSGMALANSGLGMAHGVAAALGVHCRAAHGLACAVMLPIALNVNRQVCQRQLTELAQAAGLACQGTSTSAADLLIERIEQICQRIGVPRRLAEIGVSARHIPDLVRDSRGNSMDGNPRRLSDQELTQILEAHL